MKHLPIILTIITLLIPSNCLALKLTQQAASKIGKQIWLNEGSGKKEHLIVWNQGEQFPSLGIGHFIWYPEGTTGPFKEQFQELIAFLSTHEVSIPPWVIQALKKGGAPWQSREAFLAARSGPQVNELITLLDSVHDLQIEFMIKRFQATADRLIKSAPKKQKKHIQRMLNLLQSTPGGLYLLIDYLNFKGDGLNPQERYKGSGWGLLHVLSAMPHDTDAAHVREQFARSAVQILTQRVDNAPAERNEQRWLPGWCNRIKTYTQFNI